MTSISRRELIKNASMLPLVPLIPVYGKEMFEHCEVITIDIGEKYNNKNYDRINVYLEDAEESDENDIYSGIILEVVVLPISIKRDDKAAFNSFKKSPKFEDNKYIYVITCGERAGYIMSHKKMKSRYISYPTWSRCN